MEKAKLILQGTDLRIVKVGSNFYHIESRRFDALGQTYWHMITFVEKQFPSDADERTLFRICELLEEQMEGKKE